MQEPPHSPDKVTNLVPIGIIHLRIELNYPYGSFPTQKIL